MSNQPPKITREEVLHVARLARLEIPESEVERMRTEMESILGAVAKVSELKLEDVAPTLHPLDLVNRLGEDEPRPSLSQEDALANAPESERRAFRVPAVREQKIEG